MLLASRDHAAVLPRHPLVDQARLGEAVGTINKAVDGVAALICAITLAQVVWEIVQISRDEYRRRAVAAQ
jgi:hypothetical protein